MKRSFWKELISDIFFAGKKEKKGWLIPLIIVLILLSAILVLGTALGPLAPFIYSFL